MNQPARLFSHATAASVRNATNLRRPEVMVVSHERSGTHFLMNSLGAAFGYPNANFLNFDQPDLNVNFFDPAVVANVVSRVAAQRAGAMIKSHHAVEFFQPTMASVAHHLLVFYIYRDPVDVMISFWRFMHRWSWHEGPRAPTALEFAMAEPEGNLLRYQMRQRSSMLDRWARHVEGWTQAAERNRRIVLVRYEDLRDSYPDMIARFSAIIGQSPATTTPPDPSRNVVPGADPDTLPPPDITALRELALREVGETLRLLHYA